MYTKQYYVDNKERIDTQNNSWKYKNTKKYKEVRKKWLEKNKEKINEYKRKEYFRRKFGIEIFQYDELFKKQKGRCAICKKPQSEFKRKFALDHCHKTNKIRGLLCTNCNTGIGFLNDNIDNLKNAIQYLRKFNNEGGIIERYENEPFQEKLLQEIPDSSKIIQKTSNDLDWNQAINLIQNLYNQKDYKFSLLVSFGVFWGLLITDILSLKWKDILNKNEFNVVENRSKKNRTIEINAELKKHIENCYGGINPNSSEEYIFTSRKHGNIFSIQHVNKKLKMLNIKHNLNINNITTHTLRKCFGRKILMQGMENGEITINKLSKLFSQSSNAWTFRYLGITQAS